jgi:hypothetical protein
MRLTPESKIKTAVKAAFEELHICPASKAGAFPLDSQGWYYMPVSNGMGVSGIPDFVGHYHGRLFAVETKADPKKRPTPFQRRQIEAINCRGERAFVVSSLEEAKELKQHLLNLLFLP